MGLLSVLSVRLCPVCNVGVLWPKPNVWMDGDTTWYTEVDLGPGDIVLDGTQLPPHVLF